jgi:hypothetical protein
VTHETLDQIKLAQHKLIAKKLQESPEAIFVHQVRGWYSSVGSAAG